MLRKITVKNELILCVFDALFKVWLVGCYKSGLYRNVKVGGWVVLENMCFLV